MAQRVFGRRVALPSNVSTAARAAVECLEKRTLLSSSLGATANVNWNGHTELAVIDRYTVQTKSGWDFSRFAAAKGLAVSNVINLGGAFYGFSTDVPIGQIAKWTGKYGRSIASVSPSFVMQAAAVPNDTYYADKYDLNNTGQTVPTAANSTNSLTGLPDQTYVDQAGTPGDDIDAQDAWNITTGSHSVVVAVLDTGIDLNQPDLQGNIYTNPNEIAADGIDNDHNGYIDDVHGVNTYALTTGDTADESNVTDDVGHGTHVAGIIGADGNNGTGVTGVNWNVSILPVKVLGTDGGTTESIIAGINYVTEMKRAGVNIVAMNASLGTSNTGSYLPFDQSYSNAIAKAGDAGVLFVGAAGNDALNNDSTVTFPAKFSLNLPNVITVASTDNRDNLSVFSNFGGASVDVAAPGDGILSTFPTYTVTETGEVTQLTDANGNNLPYAYESGTSQAAPHVAGIIALEAAANPTATMAQLKQALLDGVNKVPSLAGQYSSGVVVSTSGVVDAYRSLLDILDAPPTTNAVTLGNWHGKYGTEGYYLPGNAAAVPSYATLTLANNSTATRAGKAQASDLSSNVAGGLPLQTYETSSGTLSADINLTDGNTHLVTFYLANEAAGKSRKATQIETIALDDAATGIGIRSQSVTNAPGGGTYVTFQVKGHVIAYISASGGAAALNGIFFDPAPSVSNTLIGTNKTAAGNYKSVVGTQGIYLPGQPKYTSLPSGTTISTTGGSVTTAKSSGKTSALTLPGNSGKATSKTVLATTTSEDIHIAFGDSATHETSVYLVPIGKAAKAAPLADRVQVFNSSNTLIDQENVTSLTGGEYLTFGLTGTDTIRITLLSGTLAAVGGVFLDSAQTANGHFAGVDTTTHGNWQGTYGNIGSYIVGDHETFPAGYTGTFGGGAESTLSGSSTAPNALIRYTSSSTLASPVRIESLLETRTQEYVDLSVPANSVTQAAVYVTSYGKATTAERLTVIDAATGTTVSQVDLADAKALAAGEYVKFDVTGNVRIVVSNLQNASNFASISGIFFD